MGVSEHTDYPPTLLRVESVGPYHAFSLEKVIALKPELVLASTDGNPREPVERLRKMGVPVFVVATDSIEAVRASMLQVGALLGEETESKRQVAQFDVGLARFRARAKARKPVTVMLQLGERPLVVAGGPVFLNEALTLLGAKNVYGEMSQKYPRPSAEDVLSRNPETILVLTLTGEIRIFEAMARRWLDFPGLAAVQKKGIQVVVGDTYCGPTLRMLEGWRFWRKQSMEDEK